jgi:NitT/TauT family transport system substrate-binding protein
MPGRTRIRLVAPFQVPFYAPFFAALDTGAFEKEGLDVDLNVAGSGPAVVEALLSGAADVGWGGPFRVMLEQDAGRESALRCFCSVVRRDPFMLVGRTKKPGFRLEQLAGLRLGIVSEVPTPWYCLQNDLKDAGVNLGDIQVVEGNTMAENAAALSKGELDVVQLFEPFVAQLEARESGFVWAAAAERGETLYTTLVSTRRLISRRRFDFQALVRGMAATQSWILSQGPVALATAVRKRYQDITTDVLEAALKRYFDLGLWNETPAVTRESFDRLGRALLNAKVVTRMPRYDECVEAAIVHEAFVT